jgi:hypothetical protein
MVITLLSNMNNHLAAVEEQKKIWLYELLYFLGVDVEILDELPGDLAVEMLMRKHISIVDYPSMGALRVEYRETAADPLEIAGEWAGAEYLIKRDPENGEMYYEISIECWSVIDEGIDME